MTHLINRMKDRNNMIIDHLNRQKRNFTKLPPGAGELEQGLRARLVLPEDPNSVPRTLVR